MRAARCARWSLPRLRRGPGVNKFGAIAVTVDGVRFASKHEAARYAALRMLQTAGRIRDLELQPRFELLAHRPGGLPARVGSYRADFRYVDVLTGDVVIEDAKSPATRTTAYRLRKRLVEANHGIEIREV